MQAIIASFRSNTTGKHQRESFYCDNTNDLLESITRYSEGYNCVMERVELSGSDFLAIITNNKGQ
jgi:hypothetical protein